MGWKDRIKKGAKWVGKKGIEAGVNAITAGGYQAFKDIKEKTPEIKKAQELFDELVEKARTLENKLLIARETEDAQEKAIKNIQAKIDALYKENRILKRELKQKGE